MKRLLSLVLLGSPAFLKAMEGRQTTPATSSAQLFTSLGRTRYANNDVVEEFNISQLKHVPDQDELDIFEQKLQYAPIRIKGILLRRKRQLQQGQVNRQYNRLLLVGRPGTSKTTTAKAMGHELGDVYFIPATMLMKKYRNATSENLTSLINTIARQPVHSTIIIDELNKLTNNHTSEHTDADTTSTALWTAFDNTQKNQNFFLIGTTNESKKMPAALQDRFRGKIVEMLPGGPEQRKAFIRGFIEKKLEMPADSYINEEFIDELVAKTEGFTDRDLEIIMDDAQNCCYDDHANERPLILSTRHFDLAFENNEKELEKYWDLNDQISDEERRHRETLEANKKHHEESIEVSKQAQTLSDQHFVQGQQFQVGLHTNLETTQVQGNLGIGGFSSSSQKIKNPALTYTNLTEEQRRHLRNTNQ